MSARLGFVQGTQGTYRTRDRGETWEHVVWPEKAKRMMAALGAHRVLVSDRAAKAPDEGLVDLSESLVPRGGGAVGLSGERVDAIVRELRMRCQSARR